MGIDIKCMLAKTWNEKGFSTPQLLETKVDGERSFTFLNKGKGLMYSRQGNLINNSEHIVDELLSVFGNGWIIDGEVAAETFNLTGSICRSQFKHPRAKELKLIIFDLIKIEEYMTECCTRTLRDRRKQLEKMVRGKKLKYTVIVPQMEVANDRDLVKAIPKLISADKVGGAFTVEGGMLKDPASFYDFGQRSRAWQKLKPDYDGDFEIIGAVEEKDKFKRPKNRLGALRVKGKTEWRGRTYNIETEVGSGFKAVDRDKLWKMYHDGTLLGKVVQVSFKWILPSTKKTHALRHPVFERLRLDKS